MQELMFELDKLKRQLSRVQGLLTAEESDGAELPWAAPLPGEFVPAFLQRPWDAPVHRQPSNGTVLAPGAKFLSGKHQGVVLLLQKPVQGGAGGYALALDYAAFDGQWMSLVLDGRAVLAQVPAGAARLLVNADIEGVPSQNVLFKCSWRHVGQEGQSRQGTPQPYGRVVSELDLGWLRPEDVEALELHVIFPAAGRGSVVVRSLRAVLLVAPTGGGKPGAPQDVFEEAP